MNWLEKFQAMWKELLPSEQHALYDMLAMVRGPDDDDYVAKQVATARFRRVLFQDKQTVPGDVNMDDKPLTTSELRGMNGGHYRDHAIDAQRQLIDLGVWDTPMYTSASSFADDDDDNDDDSDDGDDNGDYP